MLDRRLLILLSIVLLIIGGYLFYLNSQETIPHIVWKQVKQMRVSFLSGGEQVYDIDQDREEIQKLVKAYNQAQYYRNDVDTTHPILVRLYMKNGEEIRVLGGTQGFQTVLRGGKQFNIKGQALNFYFSSLSSNKQ